MSVDQAEAKLPTLSMAVNDLLKFLDMMHVDIYLRADARIIIVPLIADIESA